MLKENKKTLILTSVLILLPLAVGLLLWLRLPDQLPVHWGLHGEVDGWANKAFVVFFLPLFLLTCHWLCIIKTNTDPKRKHIPQKAFVLILWLIPAISLTMGLCIYATALGLDIKAERLILLLVGLMFLFLGNYMPKLSSNYTIGMRVPWTLDNEENWTRTNRLAGKMMVTSGFPILLAALPGGMWGVAAVILAVVLNTIPVGYSYWLYRKQQGTWS